LNSHGSSIAVKSRITPKETTGFGVKEKETKNFGLDERVIIGGGKDLTEGSGDDEYEPDFEGSTTKKQAGKADSEIK
jgi:hypothetical protein